MTCAWSAGESRTLYPTCSHSASPGRPLVRQEGKSRGECSRFHGRRTGEHHSPKITEEPRVDASEEETPAEGSGDPQHAHDDRTTRFIKRAGPDRYGSKSGTKVKRVHWISGSWERREMGDEDVDKADKTEGEGRMEANGSG